MIRQRLRIDSKGMVKSMGNTKQKRRFNVVDALIILLILAVIAAAAVFVLSKGVGGRKSNTFEIEYVVELRTVRDEFADNIKVGDRLVDSAAKYQLGEVIAVSTSPATFTGTDLVNGALVYCNYPEHSDISLTVKASAETDSDGMYIIDSGYRISVGSTMYIRTPDFVGTGYCTRFKKTEVR